MRLALFTDTYEPDVNGVARTLARWVDYLKRQGFPVLYLLLTPPPAMGMPLWHLLKDLQAYLLPLPRMPSSPS